MAVDAVIEAEGVVKEYAGVRALDAVGFAVGEGEVFALVGPNGAGKTTLLRLLTDILRPDAGTLRLFGETRLRDVLDCVGYMPEERGLYKSLTALETVAYFARLKGLGAREAKQAAERALETVRMLGHARRKLDELSKGMSQRVQFAATIAHDPRLLILDEPFSGLDPVSAQDLQALIRAQRERGHTVLLSTHNMEHAERFCDRMLMLHRGRVVLYGPIEEIKERYTDRSYLLEFAGELPPLELARVERVGEGAARLYPASGVSRRTLLAALVEGGADVVRFEPVVPSLEEIFIRVVGEEGQQALHATRDAAAMAG